MVNKFKGSKVLVLRFGSFLGLSGNRVPQFHGLSCHLADDCRYTFGGPPVRSLFLLVYNSLG